MGSVTEPMPVTPPTTPTTPAAGGDDDRDGFDVPEWVSEFRRLYVEPKTRAALKEQAARTGRRPVPPAGAPGRPVDAAAQWEPPEQPLADEPLRSRSEVRRDRRSTRQEGASMHPDPSPPTRRGADADTSGPAAAGSRAALRRARQERARAERRMRLRRTVVVGVLLLVVAAVVTWLVARNQEPVSATPASFTAPLQAQAQAPGAAPASSVADAVGAGEASDARGRLVTTGSEASVGVRRQAGEATSAGAEPGLPPQVAPTHERAAATAAPTSTPTRPPVPRGTGSFSWVDWGEVPDARTSGGDAVRVALEVEGGLGLDRAEVATAVARILVDERGWQSARDVRFVFVSPAQAERGEFDTRVGIASRQTTDDLCAPLETDGYTSCYNGRVVINLDRWMLGVEAYEGRLDDYRTYVVDHEVGHALGLGHAPCPAKGAPAPVMVPQTLHLWGCAPNPYPVVG